jgi:leukotriene-A4 hydrolase
MPDPTSQANYLEIATEHVSFDWHIDFQQKTISGSALHNLILKQDGVSEVV